MVRESFGTLKQLLDSSNIFFKENIRQDVKIFHSALFNRCHYSCIACSFFFFFYRNCIKLLTVVVEILLELHTLLQHSASQLNDPYYRFIRVRRTCNILYTAAAVRVYMTITP